VGRWSPRKTVVGKHMMAARIKTDKNIWEDSNSSFRTTAQPLHLPGNSSRQHGIFFQGEKKMILSLRVEAQGYPSVMYSPLQATCP
jgi:hypothetical protein